MKIEETGRIIVTLSNCNIEKIDKIAERHSISRSAVVNIFFNGLTGKEIIKFQEK